MRLHDSGASGWSWRVLKAAFSFDRFKDYSYQFALGKSSTSHLSRTGPRD